MQHVRKFTVARKLNYKDRQLNAMAVGRLRGMTPIMSPDISCINLKETCFQDVRKMLIA